MGLVARATSRRAASAFGSDPSRRGPGCRQVTRKYGNMGRVKTTIEIPDLLFRTAKSTAAQRGQSLKQFVTAALREKLTLASGAPPDDEPDWMRGFGDLRRLRGETRRIQSSIDEAFETIEPEDRL